MCQTVRDGTSTPFREQIRLMPGKWGTVIQVDWFACLYADVASKVLDKCIVIEKKDHRVDYKVTYYYTFIEDFTE